MYFLLGVLLYVVHLAIVYFNLRMVYIEKPHLIDGFVIFVCLLPIAGIAFSLMALSHLFNDYRKKKILDFIFNVKKS